MQEVTTRGHTKSQTYFVLQPHFSGRVINVWNSLHESVDVGSVGKFKKSVYKIDFTKFLRCF